MGVLRSAERLRIARKSGGGPPQSKTLARILAMHERREAFWSAPAPWRFRMARVLAIRID
jgi:hypothetical protein